MVQNNLNREEEIARINADLRFYRELMREVATNPKRLATGSGGINQHSAEFHSLVDLQTIIKSLEDKLKQLVPVAATNVSLDRARGDIL